MIHSLEVCEEPMKNVAIPSDNAQHEMFIRLIFSSDSAFRK